MMAEGSGRVCNALHLACDGGKDSRRASVHPHVCVDMESTRTYTGVENYLHDACS